MNIRRIATRTVLLAALAGGFALWFCPKPTLYGNVDFSRAALDRNGTLLRLALADDQRYRLRVAIDDIAPTAIDATLLYEDQYFWSHPGVNPGALLRAAWSTYVQGNRVIGGSTITMQLARMRFGIDTRTIGGKISQIARAIQLERHYEKRQILEAYLNLAPYGGNIEGIGTASLIYFDKPVGELSIPEAMALAVIPQNPVARNPATTSGLENMAVARARLVAAWAGKFDMSDETLQLFELPLSVRAPRELPYRAPHFSRAALAAENSRTGLNTTTLDWPTQSLIEERVQSFVEARRSVGIDNASAMLIDYTSMEIIAAVGSNDFFNSEIQGQVDGTAAKRSPGSTLKPFVYGLGIDSGIIHPMSLMKDAPKRFAAYTPENFDRGFMGPIVAEDALVYSRNVPAIDLLSKVGHEKFHEFLIANDVAGLKNAKHYGLSMVLGGNELTMRELVRLYALLASGGYHRPLVSLRTTSSGDQAISVKGQQLMSGEASFLTLDMLRKNPRPDAVNAEVAGHNVPIAWKTGTSYAFRDAWTVGVFGPYVLAVWVGNFDGSGNPALVGRKAAAPLFFEIADSLPLSATQRSMGLLPPPSLNLVKVDVCKSTGDLPGRHCPQTSRSWFIPGVSPIKVSDVHRSIRIDNSSGARSCSFNPETTHEAVFEFWPSDIALLFEKAGIARRRPPPWAADCSLDMQAASGIAPRITSPSARLTYQIRSDQADTERLPLTATTDRDVKQLYWFANDRFIAATSEDTPLFWKPDVGVYDILAVDDLGRSHSRRIAVSMAH